MKIGVSAFAWTSRFTSRHLSILAALRDNGLLGFEIAMFDPADLPARNIRQAIEAHQLEVSVCAILPAGVNPISPDPSVRAKSRAHLVQCVETSSEMGAHLVCGPAYAPIGYLPGRRRNEDEWTWAVECFQSLGAVLDANEMTLAIEPVNRSETFFLNTAAEANALCDAVGHPRVGVTIDTFHANIEEKCIPAAIESSGKRLKHLHASENDRGLLGAGHVDFPLIVEALRRLDYEGFMMIEGFGYSPSEPGSLGALWGDLNTSPESIAFQGASYLHGLLNGSKPGI